MEAAGPEPARLEDEMPQFAEVWDEVVRTHDLLPLSMEELVGNSWRFADAVWRGYGATGTDSGSVIADYVSAAPFPACPPEVQKKLLHRATTSWTWRPSARRAQSRSRSVRGRC